ncbi:MAG: alpha/beta hydrolase [Beijerinckiaceae bacterium]|nr:alpha/beta hydrolase [Beijerinckiaceae bacterium]MBX9757525.1 alpha/beta hydrolase [Beijerinckiaceae bacterium]MDO9441584.1 alpha/beta hydrolase [Beijerinckiaceae bacterium]
MDLTVTHDNPVPPGASVGAIRAADGVTLRVARWMPQSEPRGTLLIATGRSEFIEKYFETIGEALTRGLVVVCFDWRGQGLSDRELSNPAKGHIDDFALYERDLWSITEQVLGPFCPKPWFALAHSMGAAILLEQARRNRSPFARMVLTAPMIDIFGLRQPGFARCLAIILDSFGLGGAFIPGGGGRALIDRPFEGNLLTSDPVRYARVQGILQAEPRLALGDPTVAWIHAAFRLMQKFADPEYPRLITTPTLIIAAADDRIVSTSAIERFSARLKAGRMVCLGKARHEILLETDEVRAQFWAAFDAFVPGTLGEAESLLARYGRAS